MADCVVTFNGKDYTQDEFSTLLKSGLLYNLLDRKVISLPIDKNELIVSRKNLEANFVKSKADVTKAMKDIFGLPQRQADAVANIYERVANSWAALRGSTKEAYYDTINFFKASPEQLKAIQPILYSQDQLAKIEEEKASVPRDANFMKAPNGKATQLSEDQWLTVQTPTFKDWFGASQVLDDNGEPKVMYHGTKEPWEIFNKGLAKQLSGGLRGQIFLSPEIEFAEDYVSDGAILQLFVKADKVFDYENSEHVALAKNAGLPVEDLNDDVANWGLLERPAYQKFIKENGFDGFTIKEYGIKNIAVFESNQIKVSDGRNQTFLSENPNILYQAPDNLNDTLEKVVKGFNLSPNTKAFSGAFNTKNGKASPNLASEINNFLITKLGIDNVKFVYEKTYGTVNAVYSNLLNQQSQAAILLGQDGNDIIYALTNPNVSSPLHELAHKWERELTDEQRQQVQDWASTPEWTVDTSEKFARGFEKYLVDGEAPTSALQGLFDLFKKWLSDIYKGLVGSEVDVVLNDDMKSIYAKMLGENYETVVAEEIATENPIVEKVKPEIQQTETEQTQPEEPAPVAVPIVELTSKYAVGEKVLFRNEPATIEGKDEDGYYTLTDSEGYIQFAKEGNISAFDEATYNATKVAKKQVVGPVLVTDPSDPGLSYQPIPEYLSKEQAVEAAKKLDMLRRVSESIRSFIPGIKVEIGFYNTPWKGRIKGGVVQINANTATLDTPIHELMHPFVMALRLSNYELYSNLIDELRTGANAYYVDLVNEDSQYDSLSPQEKEEEALVRYLGESVSSVYQENGTIDQDAYSNIVASSIRDFMKWFQEMLEKVLGYYKNRTETTLTGEKRKSSAGAKIAGFDSIQRIVYNKETSKLSGYKEGSNNSTFRIETDLNSQISQLLLREFPDEVITQIKVLVDESDGNIVEIFKKDLVTDADVIVGEEIKGISVGDIPANFTLKNLSDFIVTHNQIKIDLSNEQAAINTMEAYQFITKDQADDILKRIIKKVEVLADTSQRRIGGENFLSGEVAAVKAILRDYDDIEAITEYVRQGMGGLEFAYNLLSDIKKQLALNNGLTQQEINSLNKQLVEVKTLLSFYDDVQKLYSYTLDEYDNDEINGFQRSIAKASATRVQIANVGADLVTEWLFPKYDESQKVASDKTGRKDFLLTKDEFKKRLRFVDKDASMITYWLGSAITSRDPITAITAVVVKDMLNENVHSESQTLFNVTTEFDKFLKRTGIKNSIAEVEQHYKDNYLRKAKIWEVISINNKGEKTYGYVERWAFHEETMQDLLDDDFRKYTESLGEPKTADQEKIWNDKRYDWLIANRGNAKYVNAQFANLKNDNYFNLLYNTYKTANDKYGERKLSYGIVPQAYKTEGIVEKIKGLPTDVKGYVNDVSSNPGDILSQAKQVTTDLANKLFDSDAFEKAQDLNLDMSIYMGIKSPYTTLIDQNNLDLRLNESIIGFNRSANTFATLRDMQANADNLKMLIQGNAKLGVEARQVARVQKDGKLFFDRFFGRPSIKTEAKRINEQLVQQINDTFYGVEEFESNLTIGKVNISLNAVGKNLGFYTALNNMAFNVFAGVSNITIGNIMSLGESLGGKYYKKENWIKAQGMYASQLPNFLQDTYNPIKSKITQLAIFYDAIQGEFRDKYGKNITGNVINKYATGDSLFFINHAAEHQIQLVGMLSLMDATKVTTKAGEKITLYDAFVNDGRGYYKLRSDINWNKQDDANFMKTLHGISRDLNGNYAASDKAVLQRYWIGKLALQYRKYMYSAWRSRFSSERFDPERQDFQEGFYRTFGKKLYEDIATYRFNILKIVQSQVGKKGFTPEQSYAFNKTVYDIAIIGGTMFLAMALAGMEAAPDDKDKWAKNALLLTANRLFSDISQFSFTAPQEFIKQAKSPSASLQTLTNIMDFIGQGFKDATHMSMETYKQNSGAFKAGDSKLGAKFIKIIPAWRQFNRLARPEDQLKYYTLINKDISKH